MDKNILGNFKCNQIAVWRQACLRLQKLLSFVVLWKVLFDNKLHRNICLLFLFKRIQHYSKFVWKTSEQA